ncbi:hypothetical protein BH10ACI3_BH10ACI3_07310 [soil metagenome]
MFQNIIITILLFVFSGIFGYVSAQTPASVIKPTTVAGNVAAISDKSVSITTKTGQVDLVLTEKTAYKRVPTEPFKTFDFVAAKSGVLTDIGVGDVITASALLGSDGKSMTARTVYYVTRADITAKAMAESEEWRKRGITGKVVSVDPIVVELRTLTGSSKLTLTLKEKAKFLRYAQDSVRFDEAKESSVADVKAGDMIRALGDRSADNLTFTAEQVITGAFQTIAGTVKSIDAAKGEVVIKNLQSGKDVTIVIGDASVLKRFPDEMAQRMAGFQAGGARPLGQGGGQGGAARPVGQGQAQPVVPGGQAQGGRPGFGGAGRGAGGIDDMLDRLPTITAADLKAGDMIAISSTKNGVADRVKAIKLVAGVEPFLRLAQAGSGQKGQAVQGGFSIPGLDGVSF